MKIRWGANRFVLLSKNYAFKFPRLDQFGFGLINNSNEAKWSKLNNGRCPVIFSLPFGLLIVMPRCEPLTFDQWWEFDSVTFCRIRGITAEHKSDSFGWLNGEIVCFDYGWTID